jgi:hypothetical protein
MTEAEKKMLKLVDEPDAFSDLEASRAPSEVTSEDVTDIFSDLDKLKLSMEEASQLGSEEVTAIVDVRKPRANEFVRVSADPKMSFATSVFLDTEKEVYFVPPAIRPHFPMGLKWMVLTLAVNQRGSCFLWPLALGEGGATIAKRNKWNETARAAADLARTEWVKVISDMQDGGYRIFRAKGKLPEPVFPNKSMNDLLRLAFRNRVVDCEDHAAIKQAIGMIP